MTDDPRFTTDPIGRLVPALADRYAVERTLGRGGMAIVYLARDLKHDRQIALKILRPEIASEIGTDRFLKEIQTTAKLNHPHILPLLDSGEAGGFLFYVMPYVQGETLGDLLQRERQLSIGDSVRIAREVAEALGHAHSYGIVHRDIKPQNILLSGGHAVVADFGIARALTEAANERLTETGMAVGTPAYMSPEQALGDPNVDARSDVYSLACVLYEMLVGQIPFTGPSAQAILARHSLDSVPPPHIMRDTIPEELEGIIMCGLAKSPADRFRTGSEFAEALTTMDSGASHLRRPSRATQAPRRRIPRRREVIAAASVLLLGLGAWWAASVARGTGRGRVAGDLDPRNVAVLYFTDLSREGTLAHVADGLTDGLIDELSRVSALNVVSRNGVAPYRAGDVPRDSIARALRVGSLIEGSVEPSGERVRVAVRLVDGASGADIERASFELPTGQLLAVRDSVVGEVARLLRRRLGQEVELRERQAGTASVEAWALMQRAGNARRSAEDRLARGDADTALTRVREADSLLTQAERADPQWADPVILRSQVAYLQARTKRIPKERADLVGQGLLHAERALRLAPGSAAALEARGTLRYAMWRLNLEPDPARREALLDSAQTDLKEAVLRDPTLATAHATLSQLLYQRKDVVSAVLEARTAYQGDAYLRDAAVILDRLFWGTYDIGQFGEARRWCDEGAQRFPANWRFVECRLWILITPGTGADVEEAWRLATRADSLTPAPLRPLQQRLRQMLVGAVLGRAGARDSAETVLVRARTSDPEIDRLQDLVGYEAVMRAQYGQRDQAIALLKRYVATHPEHSFQRGGMLHWWWRDLERHPGFGEVMRATR